MTPTQDWESLQKKLPQKTLDGLGGLRDWVRKYSNSELATVVDQVVYVMQLHYEKEIASAVARERLTIYEQIEDDFRFRVSDIRREQRLSHPITTKEEHES